MRPSEIESLLNEVLAGRLDVADAVRRLETLPFESIGFAHVDHHRALRCGHPEVIFGQGKTPAQIEEIFARVADRGQNVLATRVESAAADRVCTRFPAACYDPVSRTVALRLQEPAPADGLILVVCAGTSDIPVGEEARITAEMMDQPVQTIYDVGVAGLHRLLAHAETLRSARVVVVVAGMEGALPSVVAGLIRAPVIAVPTSIGYGASFGGAAALLGMLNSCAAGLSVVNIDNGFAAGYQAALINRAGRAPSDGGGREARGARVATSKNT